MSNPELPQTTSETNTPSGWDEVSRLSNQQPPVRLDNRLDKGLNDERLEVLRQRLEKRLENAFDLIIGGLLYEGDRNNPSERRDESCYTEFLPLGPIISMEEQRAMIKEYCGTGKVEKTLGDANKKLAKAIMESEFANEIWHDGGFCRRRRADHLAGRLIFTDENQLDEAILKSIWAIDPNFYGSKEAKGLITDPDYLHHIYSESIMKKLQDNSQETDYSQIEAKDTSRYERRIGESLMEGIKFGFLTVEDILKDPFLRKEHIDSLRHPVANPDIFKTIWRLDGDSFYESLEFANYLEQIRDTNVGILKDVPSIEIKQRVAKMVETIPDECFLEILRAYERSPRKGDLVLIRTLSPFLGLSKNIPKILYRKTTDERKVASHTSAGNKKEGIKPNTIICYNDKSRRFSRRIPGLFQPTQPEFDLLGRIGDITHEICHVYQKFGSDIDPELRERYLQNLHVYIPGRYNMQAYREQLIEVEAEEFAGAFVSRMREIYSQRSRHERK